MTEIKDIFTATYNEAGRGEHGEEAQRILHLFMERIEPWIEKIEEEQGSLGFMKEMFEAELDVTKDERDIASNQRDQWHKCAKELAVELVNAHEQWEREMGAGTVERSLALAKFNQLEAGEQRE